ncbi:restriction endonuclease subunit S [Spirosoma soli]|uniref:Restriction endonuclease subunit S n=1 Tax=Spirosoma soli TaxID=1770529 RepID=A0ABW5MBY1_9BACT
MSEIKLPEGWVWKTLTDLVGKRGVFCDGDWVESKDQDEKGEIRLIQLADIGDGSFRNKSNRFLTHQKAVELRCTFLNNGDVLIARMPDPLGRACIFPLQEKSRYVTVVDVCIVRPAPDLVDNKLLTYWINAPQIRSEIDSLQSGSTRKRISRKNLSIIRFPIPPIPIQHQIVARIEELFSELDAGVKELQTALSRLKTYRRSLLQAAFSGTLNGTSQHWTKTKLGEVVDCLDHKRKPVSSKIRQTQHGDVPYYGANGQTGWINEYLFNEDLVLVVEDETFTGREKPFSYKISGKSWVNNHAHILKPKSKSVLNIDFLNYSLWYYPFLPLTTGTTGRKKLTKAALLNAPYIIPDLSTQTQIVSEIEARLSEADAMEVTIRQELVRAENLRQSILKRAFEGKLVASSVEQSKAENLVEVAEPSGPTYNGPAEQLSLF